MNLRSTSLARGYICLISLQFFYGTIHLAAKRALEALLPTQLLLLRMGGATLLMLLFTRSGRKRLLPKRKRDLIPLFVCGLLGITLNQTFYLQGLDRTTSINAGFVQMLIPIITVLFAVMARQERFRWSFLAALIVAGSGVFCLMSSRSFDASREHLVGNLFFLANTTAYSLYLVVSRATLRRVEPVVMVFWVFLFGTLGILTLFLLQAPSAPFPPLFHDAYLWTLYMAVFPTLLVYLFNLIALEVLPPSIVGLFVYLQPLVATILGITLLKESFTTRFGIGAGLIVLGLGLTQLPSRGGWKRERTVKNPIV